MATGEAFKLWREATPGARITLPRLLAGTLIVALCWLGVTFLVMAAGIGLYLFWADGVAGEGLPDLIGRFLPTPPGVLVQLLTFSGIWLGVLLAMRLVHREPLSALFGVSRRLSRSSFAKGFLAVLIASLPSELVLYAMNPVFERAPIALGAWVLLFIPLLLSAFVQTSGEEMLFRGYLMRNLANRFRSGLVWALVPGLVFTLMHWNADVSRLMNGSLLLSIASFTALAVAITWRTGNLGAAMGVHLGNNLSGFALVSHESTLNAFALFRGAPLESFAWTPGQALLIVAVAALGCALTYLLLVHPNSPFRVSRDTGLARPA